MMRRKNESLASWKRRVAAWKRKLARNPGRHWRVNNRKGRVFEGKEVATEFDEIVVSPWLHIERLDHRKFFVSIGNRREWLTVNRDGSVTIGYTEADE